MIRPFSRTTGLLLIVLLVIFLLALHALPLSEPIVGRPAPSDRIDNLRRSGRPLQAVYQVEAQAAADGWTSDRLRLAGDLWREAGDLRQAVAYWQAAAPDATTLTDLGEAYTELGRWSDAADAYDHLLKLLPGNAPDRARVAYHLGLIRLGYDPQAGLKLLHAAEPVYAAQVDPLLTALAGTPDPLRVGMALANVKLWPYAELAFSLSSDPVAYAYEGFARDMQGKDGSSQIDAAVALAPNNPQVRLLQGLHLRLNFAYKDSLQAIIQAVALDPENPALYAELGKAYQLTGDLPTAEHWLKYAASLDSHFKPLLDSFYNDEKTLLENFGFVDESTVSPDTTHTLTP